MSGLIAINALLEPDAATQEQVRRLNAALRGDAAAHDPPGEPPPGFAFDETHLPHVTLVQRYVRSEELDRVFAVVDRTTAAVGAAGLQLRAGGLSGGALGTPPGTLLASVEFEPQPAVRALHDALVRAFEPFSAGPGSAAAFFTLPGERPPGDATVVYAHEYVPRRSGGNYAPHLTAGVARDDVIARLARSHPLLGAPVAPAAVAVAHLGDLGTARALLWRRPLG
jgi:hypothetical protein